MKITLEFDDDILNTLAEKIAEKINHAAENVEDEKPKKGTKVEEDDDLGLDEEEPAEEKEVTVDNIAEAMRAAVVRIGDRDKVKLAMRKILAEHKVGKIGELKPADRAATLAAIAKIKK